MSWLQLPFGLLGMMFENDRPIFLAPLATMPGGVDYLGLRQVNLSLIQGLMPGLNSNTNRIRPYALCCWIVYKFRELKKGPNFSASEFTAYKEALEVLYVWSHKLRGDAMSLPGVRSEPPGTRGPQLLSFAAWHRVPSFFDPVEFGPSLKAELGMGFLEAEPDYYRLTRAGEALAIAFDHVLKKHSAYGRLANLSLNQATAKFARDLYPIWSRGKASAKERSIFRRALYDPEAVGDESPIGLRSRTINLVLNALAALPNGGSTEEIRASMATGFTPKRRPIPFPRELLATHQRWGVLQVRQAFRLGLESLFGWMEHQLLSGRAHSTESIAGLMTDRVQVRLKHDGFESLAQMFASMEEASNTKGLWQAGCQNQSLNLFERIVEAQSALADDIDAVPFAAWRILLLTSALTLELAAKGTPIHWLARGQVLRVSLLHWAEFIKKRIDEGDKLICQQVVETYLVSQHLRVATIRRQEGRQKLRIALEDEGLVSLLPRGKDWRPRVTSDRLSPLLELLVYSDVCDYDQGTAIYTAR